MGTLGVQEMIVVFIVALVLFGPRKLPELGRTIGKAITEFRRASNDLKSTFDREMQNLERETESAMISTRSIVGEIHERVVQQFSYDESGQPAAAANEQPSATNPSTVGASEVSGAESHAAESPGNQETAPDYVAVMTGVAPEGAVPRSESEPVADANEGGVAAQPGELAAATPAANGAGRHEVNDYNPAEHQA